MVQKVLDNIVEELIMIHQQEICSTHPHNYFFQVLSELGLLGILFYLFGIFFIIFKFINLNMIEVKI